MKQLNAEQIVDALIGHVSDLNEPYSNWYAGIASDPERRLFSEHNVDKEGNGWCYCKAIGINNSRLAEKTLIEKYGFDGGTGGGDDSSIYVYVYRETQNTVE